MLNLYSQYCKIQKVPTKITPLFKVEYTLPLHIRNWKISSSKKQPPLFHLCFFQHFSAGFLSFQNAESTTRSAFQGTVEDHVPHVFQYRILHLTSIGYELQRNFGDDLFGGDYFNFGNGVWFFGGMTCGDVFFGMLCCPKNIRYNQTVNTSECCSIKVSCLIPSFWLNKLDLHPPRNPVTTRNTNTF